MSAPVSLPLIDSEHLALLHAIDDAVMAAAGHEAFPEATWTAAARGDDSIHLVVSPDGSTAALTAPSDSFQPRHRQMFVGARPDAPRSAITAVVETALTAEAPYRITDDLVAWLPGSDERMVTALTDHGFVIDRQQHRMEVALPRREPPTWPPGIEPRAFRPGRDEAAWLQVNNRAFLNHPDQGGWIAEALARRMAEPWFDAAGFLLAWRGTEVLGFCWTKVHPGTRPIGEIFVIGVDPDAQGLGLGRALALEGLRFLAEVRHCPTGMLYVAAANLPALGLYRSLGFSVRRTDTALRAVRSGAS